MYVIHRVTHHATHQETEDRKNIVMRIIETKAPLELEQLKEYFTDKNVFYMIDYEQSDLKGDMLLTYLSNLEIPCDIKVEQSENCMDLLKYYLNFKQIVSIPFLEHKTIDILFQVKGLYEGNDKQFIDENKEIIQKWIEKLDSLSLFNMWVVNEDSFKEFVENFPKDSTNDIAGINFVSLLKHEHFYSYYNVIEEDNLKFFSAYFEEYMFKGNNLYSYWANKNNPMFLLNWAISSGELDVTAYNEAIAKDIQELGEIDSFN
jgi:hypothetical protein